MGVAQLSKLVQCQDIDVQIISKKIEMGRIIAENGMLKAGEKVSVSIVRDGDKDYLKFECLM